MMLWIFFGFCLLSVGAYPHAALTLFRVELRKCSPIEANAQRFFPGGSSTSLLQALQPGTTALTDPVANSSLPFKSIAKGISIVIGYTSVRKLVEWAQVRPLEAVATTGALFSSLMPTWGPAVYCGAFSSLSDTKFIQLSQLTVVVATIISHFLWEQFGILKGYGGRLGASAAFAVGIVLLFTRGFHWQSIAKISGAIGKVWWALLTHSENRSQLLRAAGLVLAGAVATIGLRGLLHTLHLDGSSSRGSTGEAVNSSGGWNGPSDGCCVGGGNANTTVHHTPATNTATSGIKDGRSRASEVFNPVQASSVTALLAAKVFSVCKVGSFCSSPLMQTLGLRTLDPLALVLLGSFLGMRSRQKYTLPYLWNLALQSVLGAFLMFGVNATALRHVGGILGVAAILSTLGVNAMCYCARYAWQKLTFER